MAKLIIILLLALLISTHLQAQIRTDQSSEPAPVLQYADEIKKYKRQSGAGAIMTGAGTVLLITGLILNDKGNNSSLKNDPKVWQGAGCIVTGVSFLGVGIPIWSVGSYKYKKYMNLANISEPVARLYVTPYSRGISITLQF